MAARHHFLRVPFTSLILLITFFLLSIQASTDWLVLEHVASDVIIDAQSATTGQFQLMQDIHNPAYLLLQWKAGWMACGFSSSCMPRPFGGHGTHDLGIFISDDQPNANVILPTEHTADSPWYRLVGHTVESKSIRFNTSAVFRRGSYRALYGEAMLGQGAGDNFGATRADIFIAYRPISNANTTVALFTSTLTAGREFVVHLQCRSSSGAALQCSLPWAREVRLDCGGPAWTRTRYHIDSEGVARVYFLAPVHVKRYTCRLTRWGELLTGERQVDVIPTEPTPSEYLATLQPALHVGAITASAHTQALTLTKPPTYPTPHTYTLTLLPAPGALPRAGCSALSPAEAFDQDGVRTLARNMTNACLFESVGAEATHYTGVAIAAILQGAGHELVRYLWHLDVSVPRVPGVAPCGLASKPQKDLVVRQDTEVPTTAQAFTGPDFVNDRFGANFPAPFPVYANLQLMGSWSTRADLSLVAVRLAKTSNISCDESQVIYTFAPSEYTVHAQEGQTQFANVTIHQARAYGGMCYLQLLGAAVLEGESLAGKSVPTGACLQYHSTPVAVVIGSVAVGLIVAGGCVVLIISIVVVVCLRHRKTKAMVHHFGGSGNYMTSA